MDKYIKVYDDVIDEVSCKALIDKFEDSHEYFETVHVEDGDAVISFEQIDMFKNIMLDIATLEKPFSK